jgi:hypothetical protein
MGAMVVEVVVVVGAVVAGNVRIGERRVVGGGAGGIGIVAGDSVVGAVLVECAGRVVPVTVVAERRTAVVGAAADDAIGAALGAMMPAMITAAAVAPTVALNADTSQPGTATSLAAAHFGRGAPV